MIVVDSTVVLDFVLGDPTRGIAAGVLAADPRWAVPILWRSEVANVLATRMRHGALTLEEAQACFSKGSKIVEGKEHPVDHGRVLRACAVSGCTAYDCEYVILAETLGVPLVTSDRQVLDAFPGIAITPEAFVERGR